MGSNIDDRSHRNRADVQVGVAFSSKLPGSAGHAVTDRPQNKCETRKLHKGSIAQKVFIGGPAGSITHTHTQHRAGEFVKRHGWRHVPLMMMWNDSAPAMMVPARVPTCSTLHHPHTSQLIAQLPLPDHVHVLPSCTCRHTAPLSGYAALGTHTHTGSGEVLGVCVANSHEIFGSESTAGIGSGGVAHGCPVDPHTLVQRGSWA